MSKAAPKSDARNPYSMPELANFPDGLQQLRAILRGADRDVCACTSARGCWGFGGLRPSMGRGRHVGWGAAAAAIIVAFLIERFGIIKNIDQAQWWFLPVASAFVALLAVSLIHAALIAPYRAWRMLDPFRIKSGLWNATKRISCGKILERQRAAVAIKNKSYRQRSNCVLHIQNVSDFDNQHHSFPRFIKEFSVQRGETKQIEFLSWTARKRPYENDKSILLTGPVGGGWDGNIVALPCGSYDMELRVGVAEVDAIRIFCRVWIEGDELKAAKRGDC